MTPFDQTGIPERPEDDAELVDAFVNNKDNDALEALLRRHEDKVIGLAFRITGNRPDALDAAQEVFLTVFRKAGSFRHQSAFSTWLYRLTVNACHDLGRKKARTPVPVEETVLSGDKPLKDARGDGIAAVDSRLDLQAALLLLTPEQRTAVVMRDVYQMPYEEIAEITKSASGTVKSRIARARMALAEHLSGDPGNTPSRPAV